MYGIGIATKLIGGGIAGGLNAGAQNDLHDAQIAAYSHLPAPPDYQHLWQEGWGAQNAATPGQANADFDLRKQIVGRGLSNAMRQYATWNPVLQQDNLNILNQIDPQYTGLYKQLAGDAGAQLAAGTQLTPEQLQQANAYIGAAQAARGNVLGNAPVSAQALYDSQLGQQLYQQRFNNALQIASSGGPEARFGEIGGNTGAAALGQGIGQLTAPGLDYYQAPQNWGRQYVNNANLQWQGNEQNALAQASAAYNAVPRVNPWLASLAAASGALAGSSASQLGVSGGQSNPYLAYTSYNPAVSYGTGQSNTLWPEASGSGGGEGAFAAPGSL